MGIFWDVIKGGGNMSKVEIYSEDGKCTKCNGSGIIELEPFYYICCFDCGGTGKADKEETTENE